MQFAHFATVLARKRGVTEGSLHAPAEVVRLGAREGETTLACKSLVEVLAAVGWSSVGEVREEQTGRWGCCDWNNVV